MTSNYNSTRVKSTESQRSPSLDPSRPNKSTLFFLLHWCQGTEILNTNNIKSFKGFWVLVYSLLKPIYPFPLLVFWVLPNSMYVPAIAEKVPSRIFNLEMYSAALFEPDRKWIIWNEELLWASPKETSLLQQCALKKGLLLQSDLGEIHGLYICPGAPLISTAKV